MDTKPTQEEEGDAFVAPTMSAEFTLRVEEQLGSAGMTPVDLHDPGEAPGRLEERARELAERGQQGRARYFAQREVGRGGMGAVLEVFDTELRRRLAMKVLTRQVSGGPSGKTITRPFARFVEEAQVTGQLEHPGVVPVHELGMDEHGRAYFTMRLVRGREFRELIQRIRAGDTEWTLTRGVGLLLQFCETMAYAHAKGVVHRDLKPANLMVGHYGEAYVMDWGLAKVLARQDAEVEAQDASIASDRRELSGSNSGSALLTADGAVVGTPAYMPPEQARGEVARVAERSDVYAMGAILYHLLSGRAPYGGEDEAPSAASVLERVQAGPPAPLADLSPDVPDELVSICEKAMQRSIEARYSGMQAMAQDLRAYLENRVVRAHKRGALVELRKWVSRNRALAASIAISSLVLILVLLGSSLVLRGKNADLAEQSRLARERADENERLALANGDLAEQALQSASEAEAARDAAQALLAERDEALALERERARELDSVAAFQDEQLRGLRASAMALRLREGVRSELVRVRESLEGEGDLPEAWVERLEAITWMDLALDLLAGEFYEPALSTIEREFGAQPLVRARLLQAVALSAHEAGLLELARDPQRTAYELRLEHLGPDAEPTLDSLEHHLSVSLSSGDYEAAEALLPDFLQRTRESLGPENERTLYAEFLQTTVNQLRGRHELVVEALGAALPALRATPENNIELQLASMMTLARSLLRLEQVEQAESVLEEGVALSERTLPEADPIALALRGQRANLYFLQGRLDAAEQEHRAMLALRRRVWGSQHPWTLLASVELGDVLVAQGQAAAAEALFAQALTVGRQTLSAESPARYEAAHSLGLLLLDADRWDEAEPHLREALEGAQRVWGEASKETILLCSRLGQLLRYRGELAAAEPYYRRALDASRALWGDAHEQTVMLTNNMGYLLQAQGRLAEAEPLFRAALEIARRDYGLQDSRTLNLLLRLGFNQLNQERYEAAEAAYREVLDVFERALPPHAPEALSTLYALRSVHLASGELERAAALEDDWIERVRDGYGEDADELVGPLYGHAQTLARLGRWHEALPHALEGVRLLESAGRASSEEGRGLAALLAALYADWNSAEPSDERAEQAARWEARRAELESPRTP